MPLKINVFGAAHYGNVGDDLIGLALQQFLQTHVADSQVTIYPQHSRYAIEQADIVVIGGGGLIYDYDMANVRNYLQIINEAQADRIPVYMMGIGVQHVFSQEACDMYRQTLPFVTAISTRGEHDSRFITQELGYPASRVVTARDLVFLLEPDAHTAPDAPEPTSRRPKLALSLADWQLGSNYKKIDSHLASDYTNYRRYLSRHLPRLAERYDVTIVCQAREDIELSQELGAMFGVTPVYLQDFADAMQLITIYQQQDLVVTNRYHGFIGAMVARTPVYGVSYGSHKTERLVQDSFPSLAGNFLTIRQFYEQDMVSRLLTEPLPTLAPKTLQELDKCVKLAYNNTKITKIINNDIARRALRYVED